LRDSLALVATDTELAAAVSIEILVVRGLVQSVARQAVHWLTSARIQRFRTEWVGDGVLVRVAQTAELDRVCDEKHGAITTVGSVASSALEIAMRLEATLLPGGCPAGIVTREAQVVGLALEESLPLAGVRIVAGGTVRASRRNVRKDRRPVLLHRLGMAVAT
jgi:hypothetical protein